MRASAEWMYTRRGLQKVTRGSFPRMSSCAERNLEAAAPHCFQFRSRQPEAYFGTFGFPLISFVGSGQQVIVWS